MQSVTPRKPLLPVVAAALIAANGDVLVQQRPPGKSMARLWEFPGGKIEPGESPNDALVRELYEELGIIVDPDDLEAGPFVTEPLGSAHLVLLLFLCRQWSGTPEPRHATQLAWHPVAALGDLAMPPADIPLIETLKLFLPPIR